MSKKEETFEEMMQWEIIDNLDNIEDNLNFTSIEIFKKDTDLIEMLERIYR